MAHVLWLLAGTDLCCAGSLESRQLGFQWIIYYGMGARPDKGCFICSGSPSCHGHLVNGRANINRRCLRGQRVPLGLFRVCRWVRGEDTATVCRPRPGIRWLILSAGWAHPVIDAYSVHKEKGIQSTCQPGLGDRTQGRFHICHVWPISMLLYAQRLVRRARFPWILCFQATF